LVLSVLKEIEARVMRDSRGVVTLKLGSEGPTDAQVAGKLEENGFRIASWRVSYSKQSETRQLSFTVHWRRPASELQPPPLIAELAETAGVLEIGWRA